MEPRDRAGREPAAFPQHVRAGQRGMAAQIDFVRRREPAQIESLVAHRAGHQEGRLRQVHLARDVLHPLLIAHRGLHAHGGRVAAKRRVGEGIDVNDRLRHPAMMSGRPQVQPLQSPVGPADHGATRIGVFGIAQSIPGTGAATRQGGCNPLGNGRFARYGACSCRVATSRGIHSMIDEFLNDLRFGIRTLLKNRGFALLAILTLGLGIGANTAIFSVIYGVLLKPLPYTDSDRLVLIRQSAPLVGRADAGVSIRNTSPTATRRPRSRRSSNSTR